MAMKAYTLGIHGMPPRPIMDAAGIPSHRSQADVTIVAPAKAAAHRLLEAVGIWISLTDSEFRVDRSEFAGSLLGHFTEPIVIVTALTAAIGAPVIAVDESGHRQVGAVGRNGYAAVFEPSPNGGA